MTPDRSSRGVGTLSSPMSATPSPSQILYNMRLSAGAPARITPKRGTPDRFIPSLTSATSFRMGASTADLSPDERLLRHHIKGSQRERSNSPVGRGRDADAAARGSLLNQRLSAGGVGMFAVGIPAGLAPEAPVVPRQRGREINGNIFSNKRSPEKEKESHELRLSAALGVDRCRKVLTFTGEREVGSGPIVRRGAIPGSPSAVPSARNVLWESVLECQNGRFVVEESLSSPRLTYDSRLKPQLSEEASTEDCSNYSFQGFGCPRLERRLLLLPNRV